MMKAATTWIQSFRMNTMMTSEAELLAAVTALALAMSEGKSIDELNFLTVVLDQLSNTISTISAQKSLKEGKGVPLEVQQNISFP